MFRSSRLVAPAAVVVALLLAGCGGGGGVVALALVKGLVTDANGVALAGVTIRSGTAGTTSVGDGSYSLSVAAGARVKIAASRPGRASTFAILSLAGGQTALLDFALHAIGQSTPLTSLLTTPATVTDPRGAEVNLAANTLVDSTGAPVDAATVDVTTALPSDAEFAAGFPGLFIGTTGGVDADIESFGYVTIDITSSTGLACNLKSGATADIAIPVAPASDPGTPTIDLWALDETTGKWDFVVAATRDASGAPVVYRATVSHFSTYNCDRPITQSVPLTITVKNSNGATVAGANVVVTSKNQTGGGMWQGRGVTAANGTVFFPVVPPGTVKGTAVAGNQVGSAGSYDVTNGVATMAISIFAPTVLTPVTRTFTVVYMDGNVETPVPNLHIYVNIWAHPDVLTIEGDTDGNGQVTLNLHAGGDSYECNAIATINGATYVPTVGSAGFLNDIPDKWVLIPLL